VINLKIEVEFRNVCKFYGKTKILSELNLSIEKGSLMVIFGLPSCGKSVLLRLLLGIERVTSGQIFLRGSDATNVPAGKRNIGYIPQSFALYPHLNVYGNIAYPLKLMHYPSEEIDDSVKKIAGVLKISDLLKKSPNQLSGGEKQRVAIGRGLVKNANFFVLDDPLTGLDFKLREQLIGDLGDLQEKFGFTFLYATSEPLEAMTLGKNVCVLDQAKIIETGALEKLYRNPTHLITMKILGFPPANIIKGECYKKSGGLICKTDLFEIKLSTNLLESQESITKEVFVGLRPENMHIGNYENKDEYIKLGAEITLREDVGGEEIIYLDVQGNKLTSLLTHQNDYQERDNNLVNIYIKPSDIFVYNKSTEQLIGKGDVISIVKNKSSKFTQRI